MERKWSVGDVLHFIDEAKAQSPKCWAVLSVIRHRVELINSLER